MLAIVPLLILTVAASDADKLIKKGVQLRKQRKDTEALYVFKAAHALKPTAHALAQIALAEQALASWVDADQHLSTALADADDPWIKSNRAPLEKALKEIGEHVATVTIAGAPEGASLKIGKKSSVDRARVACDAPVSIEATAPGYQPYSRSITPACGREERVELAMEKEAPIKQPPIKQPPIEQKSQLAHKEEPPQALEHADIVATVKRETPTSLTPYAIVAGGAALAGAGTGVAMLFVREGHVSKYNDDAVCLPPNGMTRDQNCRREREAAADAKLVSIVGFASGAALGATALILFLLDDSSAESPVACGPIVGAAGLACAGVFE